MEVSIASIVFEHPRVSTIESRARLPGCKRVNRCTVKLISLVTCFSSKQLTSTCNSKHTKPYPPLLSSDILSLTLLCLSPLYYPVYHPGGSCWSLGYCTSVIQVMIRMRRSSSSSSSRSATLISFTFTVTKLILSIHPLKALTFLWINHQQLSLEKDVFFTETLEVYSILRN